MKHSTRYFDSIENFTRMSGVNKKNYNLFVFKLMGIKNDKILKILNFSSPLFFYVNILLSSFYTFIIFILSLVYYLFRGKYLQTYENKDIFLFFTPLFYSRCKASGLFGNSYYWIVGPGINIQDYDLTGKVIVNCKDCITVKDCINAAYLSFKAIFQYAQSSKKIYSIYKVWDYHLVQMGLEKIVINSNIFFSNQSDRWALMFDTIPTNQKTLLQHGIDTIEYEMPHKLKHIDVFYAISEKTWYNSFYSLLGCKPKVKLMKATFNLINLNENRFTVLIVSNLITFEIEKKIFEYFSNTDVSLYVKKHPTQKEDIYTELKKQYDFQLIIDNRFPCVNFVISYFSTLAYEYLAYNIPVFMYEKDKFDIIEMEKEYLKIRNTSKVHGY